MSCGLVAAVQDRRGRRFNLSVCAKVLFIWKVLPLFPFGKDTKVVHIGAVSLLLWTGIESTFYFFSHRPTNERTRLIGSRKLQSLHAPLRATNAGAEWFMPIACRRERLN
jgi:hypothetical protein